MIASDSVAVGGVESVSVVPRHPTRTGSQTFMTAAELPSGWMQVTHFYDRDNPDFYAGPLLSETADVIEVEVYGEPLRFWKRNCLIDPKSRPEVGDRHPNPGTTERAHSSARPSDG